MPVPLPPPFLHLAMLGGLAALLACAPSSRPLVRDPLRHVTAERLGPVHRFDVGLLDEASGLALAAGDTRRFWVLNDGGHAAELVLVDSAAGTVRRVPLRGAVNRDWEDLAAGPCPRGRCLYVGDIGDNGARRSFVTVYRLPEPTAAAPDTSTIERLDIQWPEGPDDAEAMSVDSAGVLWFVSKGRGKQPQRLARVEPAAWATHGCVATGPTPCAHGPVTAVAVQPMELPVASKEDRITSAAVSPDQRLMALRTYNDVLILPRHPDGTLDRSAGVRCTLEGLQLVGESVAWLPDLRLMLATEEAAGRPASFRLVQCPLPTTSSR